MIFAQCTVANFVFLVVVSSFPMVVTIARIKSQINVIIDDEVQPFFTSMDRELGNYGLIKVRQSFESDRFVLTSDALIKKYGHPPYWFYGEGRIQAPRYSQFKHEWRDEIGILYQWLYFNEEQKLQVFGFKFMRNTPHKNRLIPVRGDHVTLSSLDSDRRLMFSVHDAAFDFPERPATGIIQLENM
jgi:hypothetical protein